MLCQLLTLPLTDPIQIFLLVLIIILMAPLLSKIHIPHIIVLILAGMALGPFGLNVLADGHAQIPTDMKSAAFKTAGKDRLIDVPYSLFLEKMEGASLTDSERRRALHFYMENERVKRAFAYLFNENISAFLECERETEISQENLLRNTMIEGEYRLSPEEAVQRANSLFSLGIGSARVMGGGFAGTVLCFVPNEEKEAFRKSMADFYGAANVVEGKISNRGPYGMKR